MAYKKRGSNKLIKILGLLALLGVLFIELISTEERVLNCTLNADGYSTSKIFVILEEFSPLVNLWADGNRAAKMNGDFGSYYFSASQTSYNKSYKIFKFYTYYNQPYLELDLLQNKAVLIYRDQSVTEIFRGSCNRL